MAEHLEMLKLARRHRRDGRLREASELVREILRQDTSNAEALHLLAVIAHQLEKFDYALQCARHAVEVQPNNAVYICTLGVIFRALGRADEAIACYEKSIQLSPSDGKAYFNLGNALREKGRLEDAIRAYKQSLQCDPSSSKSHYNLGLALQLLGKLDQAIYCFEKSIKLRPDYVDVRIDLGALLAAQGKRQEAIQMYQQVLRYDPRCIEAYNNLGHLLSLQGNHGEALKKFQSAVQLEPKNAVIWNNVGDVYLNSGQLEKAKEVYLRAISVAPNDARSHLNLGHTLYELGDMQQAITAYDEALRCQSDFPEAHLGRAKALLMRQDYENGWPEFEWRLEVDPVRRARPRFPQPAWDGSPLDDKTLLLYNEPGFGGTFQFIRYASWIERQQGEVIFACTRRLLETLSQCPGLSRIVPQEDPLPEFDVHAPLLSLPRLLGSFGQIPGDIPYLAPSPERVETWRSRLSQVDGFKVGIVWRGNAKNRRGKRASVLLSQFQPLAEVRGVRLISLQKGPGIEQLARLRDFQVVDLGPQLDQSTAFADTAAVIANLDLVITVDTAVAHLAGALGAPVWVALSMTADWRWGLHGEETPWYPTMRLFRQSERGNWSEVFQRIGEALGAYPR